MVKVYDYFKPDGSYLIRITAKSQEHAEQLKAFAFSHTLLSYDDWCVMINDWPEESKV